MQQAEAVQDAGLSPLVACSENTNPLAAARRDFAGETGPGEAYWNLADFRSNTFEMEWPLPSGRGARFQVSATIALIANHATRGYLEEVNPLRTIGLRIEPFGGPSDRYS